MQWVIGVLGIAWALLVGAFIALGGAERLTTPQYVNLIDSFDRYEIIGLASMTGGVLGVIGLTFDIRWISMASAFICGAWNGLLAGYTIPANWTVPGGGNLIGLYAVFVSLLYFMRIVLLYARPGPGAIGPR